jgi:high affinity Mn2+ porin
LKPAVRAAGALALRPTIRFKRATQYSRIGSTVIKMDQRDANRTVVGRSKLHQHSTIAALAIIWVLAARPALGDGRTMSTATAQGITLDWTGLYVGGYVGQSLESTSAILREPNITASTKGSGTLFGGGHAGYNYLLSPRILLGVEAAVSFPNFFGADNVVWSTTTTHSHLAEEIEYLGTIRGRLGHVFGPWVLYGTGGFAWSGGQVFQSPAASDNERSRFLVRTGWSLGAGLERAIDGDWTARLEYLYTDFGTASVKFPPDTRYQSTLDINMVRLGLSRKLDWPTSGTTSSPSDQPSTATDASRWEIHGQTTFVYQGYPPFHAPYTGINSLTPGGQGKETWTSSAFLGLRLWEGGELYYNPELFQGFGLNNTTGAAGFTNGEAQKSSFLYPQYSTSRLFLRQTVGLGGEQETIESAYGQMAGKEDVSHVTLQAGRFAVHDLFDTNAYAQDPRVDFLNWSIWAAGAFDYPADRIGLTWGAAIELNQKDWAARLGYFLVGNKPNADTFDLELFKRGGYIGELETRYQLFSQPGKFRVIGWLHSTFSGSYREAVDLTLANPGLDATDAIEQTRAGRIKYGYVVNVEQAISKDLGVFGRWSWNNGTDEISAFTDIDASLSFGTSIKGTGWGRPEDRVGLAAAFNALSKDHRDYLAVGGLGILIGDGQINYRPEQVLEAYYALNVAKGVTLTFDYQNLTNLADNADRGPVHVFSGRLHGEF